MLNQLIAVAAIFGASALAQNQQASGHAIVLNQCAFDVTLNNVPAAGEGGQAVSKTLKTGDSYSQAYTELTSASGSHDGWAIKLQPASSTNDMIMQYEYTWQPTSAFPTFVWFDMSYVNGDPFNGNWMFSSTNSSCQDTLTHAAYAYSTDDAQGMQKPCDCDNDVQLTLCQTSGNPLVSAVSSVISAVTSAIIPAASSSSVALTTSAVVAPASTTSSTAHTTSSAAAPETTTSAAAVPTTTSATSQSSTHAYTYGFGGHTYALNQLNAGNEASPSATTFATAVSSKTEEFFGHTVTEVETAFVTQYVTAEAEPTEVRKRHEHHAAHHHNA